MTNTIKKAEESLFYLGKYHLESKQNERDVIASGVSQLIVHPSFDAHADSYDGDIAIAVLLRTIEFTNFIIPICIWTETSSYNDVVGHNGFVAGN